MIDSTKSIKKSKKLNKKPKNQKKEPQPRKQRIQCGYLEKEEKSIHQQITIEIQLTTLMTPSPTQLMNESAAIFAYCAKHWKHTHTHISSITYAPTTWKLLLSSIKNGIIYSFFDILSICIANKNSKSGKKTETENSESRKMKQSAARGTASILSTHYWVLTLNAYIRSLFLSLF